MYEITQAENEITQRGAGIESDPWESLVPSFKGACIVRGCVRCAWARGRLAKTP